MKASRVQTIHLRRGPIIEKFRAEAGYTFYVSRRRLNGVRGFYLTELGGPKRCEFIPNPCYETMLEEAGYET